VTHRIRRPDAALVGGGRSRIRPDRRGSSPDFSHRIGASGPRI
jgi:hypothetical protein